MIAQWLDLGMRYNMMPSQGDPLIRAVAIMDPWPGGDPVWRITVFNEATPVALIQPIEDQYVPWQISWMWGDAANNQEQQYVASFLEQIGEAADGLTVAVAEAEGKGSFDFWRLVEDYIGDGRAITDFLDDVITAFEDQVYAKQ